MAKIKKEIVDNSRILEMNIEDVMHNSMIPYSECVSTELCRELRTG